MAKFNEILVGRYNRFLQKVLSMKGGPPSAQLSTEIQPQFSFPDLGKETRIFLGWDHFYFSANVPAGGVGNTSGVKIRNPVANNVIVVVEKITFSSPLVQLPFINRQVPSTDFVNLFTGAFMDARNRRNSSAIISTKNADALTPGATVWAGIGAANSTIDVIIDDSQQMVVAPDDSLALFQAPTNQALFVALWWRERALEEGELK